MPKTKYTILFEKEGVFYKLCKIIFGADGSYYVTVPYHSADKGIFLKCTVNYNQFEMVIPVGDAIDIASSDEKRIKLSHHPDGFVQFSGQGLISGKDVEGNIKGIGVMSWPLSKPVHGPAFTIVAWGIEKFKQVNQVKRNSCIFSSHNLIPNPRTNGLILEGHYFPPEVRRFIQVGADGTQVISIIHPVGIMMPLKVLLSSNTCSFPGFIGLSLWEDHVYFSSPSGFAISGSTGNIRYNAKGDRLGDGIFCIYPLIDNEGIRRSLSFRKSNKM
jgi:hypothetical protein